MLATVEVRWFHEGDVPDAAARWFERLGPAPEAPEPRTDRYLAPTGPALNVKLREGNAEAKRRDADGTATALAGSAAGTLEHWRKWSFPLADAAEPPDDAHWIPVRKARRLRRYRLTDAGAVEEVTGTDASPERSCDLELSRLDAAGRRFWTICFEAAGPDAAETLRRTAAHVFAPAASPNLTAEASMAYPQWLIALNAASSRR